MKKIEMLKNKIKSARENTGEEGFSLIELVVAVGILLILSVVGVVSYSGITNNARQATVDAAAAEVLTAAVAYDSDSDAETTPEKAAETYNNSTKNIKVVANKTGDVITVSATEINDDGTPRNNAKTAERSTTRA